ncbi:hypothetical protein SFC43_34710 [Bacteroides sp. CR5/BHMF/2]|nr:hypothetical protein [Bacteroides sp. CR5/BHMF/2]
MRELIAYRSFYATNRCFLYIAQEFSFDSDFLSELTARRGELYNLRITLFGDISRFFFVATCQRSENEEDE